MTTLKQCPRTACVAWCAAEAAPTLMALGSSASSAAGIMGGDVGGEAKLDLVSFDLAKPGQDMDVLASIRTDGGRRFSSISWGSLGADGPFPYGIIAGGLQEGIVSIWNPYQIVNSNGSESGLIHSGKVHEGSVNNVEFHPMKPSLLATCGADGEVNIVNVENPTKPDLYKPSEGTKTHEGSQVLSCAWNRKVPHILSSCSNKGTTVVWDLKQKKEVISFQDPASRQRCSDVVWNPEKPTQLLVAYDDDRQPSMQMWDLRNVKYPFKETAGHSKGILGVEWNIMDPNLILSCGKDNRLICWFNGSTGMESFCEIPSPHANFEVKWAPHKPSLIATASFNGCVSLHSVQMQQNAGTKYCPSWYRRPCGVSFGFGGKLLAYGTKKAAAALSAGGQAPPSSWCHSLIVPNEPEIVATADAFENVREQRRLQEFCQDKTQSHGGTASHEGLMWDIMGLQFEDQGRQRVPSLLGFDANRIAQEAERFLGQKPGTTLMGPPPEEQSSAPVAQAQRSMGPELGEQEADDFFSKLAESTEQQKAADAAAALALQKAAEKTQSPEADGEKTTDWSAGPENLIKQSLLVGNLTAAVECCFKSGRMAEALLLASGGGTTLWTRARDEYLRLQGDAFLTTVGNIMTADFEKLVSSSDLKNWMETLAIIATYSEDRYPALCEQLAERLEKENFDIRSAVICYICAKNFTKTVTIWANTHVASSGSKKVALQDLVEKMAVLQEATRFNQADALFNAKLTQYAEILANSGRLTAAMRYLCLLRDDASSSILRDRIYNSAPVQMSQIGLRPPAFPFEPTDVRILYQPPPQAAAQPQYHMNQPAGHHAAAPHMNAGHMRPHAPMPNVGGMNAPAPAPSPPMPPRPSYPGPSAMPPAPAMPTAPAPHMGGMGGAAPGYPGMAPPAPTPPAPNPLPPPGPGMGPAPRVGGGGGGMPPAPNVGGMPPAPNMGGPGMGGPGMGGPGMGGPGMGAPGMGAPGMGGAGMGAPGMGGAGMGAGAPSMGTPGMGAPGMGAPGMGGYSAPVAGPGVLPPGSVGGSPCSAPPGMPPSKSTHPTSSAAPVIEDMPVAWPLPTASQQKLSSTQSTAAANQAIQGASQGGAAAVGEPMAAHDLTHVKNVLSMLLDASSQDGNMKKREDIAKRLEDLYTRLANGQMKTSAAQKVLHMVKCVEAQDYAGANKTQMELCTIDWNTNKDWLMGVKRLIPRG